MKSYLYSIVPVQSAACPFALSLIVFPSLFPNFCGEISLFLCVFPSMWVRSSFLVMMSKR